MSFTNRIILSLILFSIVWLIVETESTFYNRHAYIFDSVDVVIAILFTVEYAARVWAVGQNSEYKGLRGRLKYIFSIWALVDLAAVLPYYLAVGTNESFLLRLLRFFRVLAIGRLGKYSRALRDFGAALRNRKYDLYVAAAISISIIVTAATGMYLLESPYQPDAFGSIPRAIWWSVTSFTPLAGGIVPQTIAGKAFAAISALAGIGLVAMPTAILAAAFSEVFQKRKRQDTKVD